MARGSVLRLKGGYPAQVDNIAADKASRLFVNTQPVSEYYA
ncbi:hypothetical protein E5Q_03272 [Mixia osmundae IAM 14324]|uniref:Uncharacterized protein n=1 Tax=Mixia osmundae (strain CBS 9802 / IAM 14324 / JCM 22182 / KY 12970) TaxID=764103 RepID=G7E192_MIXOS|nr:hypothetical protein E5Q_03272 [Mixia osmundae IAM 14324]